MIFNSAKELAAAGAVLVDHESGATWNDGGRWNTWVYELPSGDFWKAHQPTDYGEEIHLSKVIKVETKVITYKEDLK